MESRIRACLVSALPRISRAASDVPFASRCRMFKWLLTLILALLVMGAMTPWLRKFGFGRLPGDFEFERDGKRYSFPLGSTIMLSLLASLIYWSLR